MFGPSRRELSRQLERERARNQQREGELLDRLMLMAGRPWTIPPAEAEPTPMPEDEDALVSALDVLPEEWDTTPGWSATG